MARAVDLATHYIEAMKDPVDYYRWYLTKFKLICGRSTQDSTLMKPSHAVKLISVYAGHRMQVELGRLTEIIHCLQMSDYEALKSLQSRYYQAIHKS